MIKHILLIASILVIISIVSCKPTNSLPRFIKTKYPTPQMGRSYSTNIDADDNLLFCFSRLVKRKSGNSGLFFSRLKNNNFETSKVPGFYGVFNPVVIPNRNSEFEIICNYQYANNQLSEGPGKLIDIFKVNDKWTNKLINEHGNINIRQQPSKYDNSGILTVVYFNYLTKELIVAKKINNKWNSIYNFQTNIRSFSINSSFAFDKDNNIRVCWFDETNDQIYLATHLDQKIKIEKIPVISSYRIIYSSIQIIDGNDLKLMYCTKNNVYLVSNEYGKWVHKSILGNDSANNGILSLSNVCDTENGIFIVYNQLEFSSIDNFKMLLNPKNINSQNIGKNKLIFCRIDFKNNDILSLKNNVIATYNEPITRIKLILNQDKSRMFLTYYNNDTSNIDIFETELIQHSK